MTKPAIDISAGLKPRAGKSAPEEPNTGRDVLHTPIHAARIQALATAEHPAVKSALQGVVKGVHGAKLHGARDKKSAARLDEKINAERQPPRTIPDYSAFRVSVDSPDAKEKAVKAIRGNFSIAREKDEFEHGAPDSGFHAHMLQVRRPGSGVSHEVQVLPREQANAAETNHKLYDKARDGGGAAAENIKAKNHGAMTRFNARNGVGAKSDSERKGGRRESAPAGGVEQAAGVASNGAPVASNGSEVPALPKIATGSSVALADGRAGIVKWIMGGKIRIQTPEGGRVDAKLADATPIPPLEKTGGNWDGVDVDGTLAHYDGFKGATVIGPPVQAMVDHVKEWLAAGQDVRIFTARISHDPTGGARKAVQAWSLKYLGRVLPVTDKKDSRMRVMYDDRAVQVSRNRGELLGDPKAAASDGRPRDAGCTLKYPRSNTAWHPNSKTS